MYIFSLFVLNCEIEIIAEIIGKSYNKIEMHSYKTTDWGWCL